jgi:hypothetical protein
VDDAGVLLVGANLQYATSEGWSVRGGAAITVDCSDLIRGVYCLTLIKGRGFLVKTIMEA